MRTLHGVLVSAAITLIACGKEPKAVQAPTADSATKAGGMQMAGAHLPNGADDGDA